MKKKNKALRILSAALVLLCLVLITGSFNTGMLARYATKASGSDAAEIASFSVAASSSPSKEAQEGSNMAGYEITLTNNSETAVAYVARVSFPEELEADRIGVQIRSGEDWETMTDLCFRGQLKPGGNETAEIRLDLGAYLESLEYDSFYTFRNDDIGGGEETVPFQVIVTFTQMN